jgi:hypothetical protein
MLHSRCIPKRHFKTILYPLPFSTITLKRSNFHKEKSHPTKFSRSLFCPCKLNVIQNDVKTAWSCPENVIERRKSPPYCTIIRNNNKATKKGTDRSNQQSSRMKSLKHSSLCLMLLLEIIVLLTRKNDTATKRGTARSRAPAKFPDEVFDVFFFVLDVLTVDDCTTD